jgi:hypothetical protein
MFTTSPTTATPTNPIVAPVTSSQQVEHLTNPLTHQPLPQLPLVP